MSTAVAGLTAAAPPAAAPAAAATTSDPKIREAAEAFEGVFMSMLVEEMMKSTEVAKGNPLYTGLMTEKLGDQISRSGGIGLADVIERQMGGGAA
ncbi:rod-binding protein [Miltoncostaea oceani]|uniref:rod-binding protein n=1 Tax=Miltoncostaea oceani TaxID=2843216 RepID=UPI001C3D5140|nr:rod-binding protein [Miltoncostaea oceani]